MISCNFILFNILTQWFYDLIFYDFKILWLQVVCVVQIKLFFYGLILLYFDNTNYVMQNTKQKFRQSSIVFEKPSILPENLKNLTSSNYPTVRCFLLKLRSRFLLTNVYKRVCVLGGRGEGLLYLDLSYFQKLKKTWFLHTRFLHLYW